MRVMTGNGARGGGFGSGGDIFFRMPLLNLNHLTT